MTSKMDKVRQSLCKHAVDSIFRNSALLTKQTKTKERKRVEKQQEERGNTCLKKLIIYAQHYKKNTIYMYVCMVTR